MTRRRQYTRDELEAAVASSRSWRGVLRALGRPEHSAGARRVIQREATALGIDHSHFTGQRRWNDAQLEAAVAKSHSWSEVLRQLEISSGNQVSVRANAARLGLDTSHFERGTSPSWTVGEPKLANLRIAGPTLAAAWFMLHGYEVTWPLEPCRYDLIVRTSSDFQRVQVKTATYRAGGCFAAHLSNSRRPGHRDLYDVDEIDSFFVIDAELNAYWIPFADVAGYGQISLRSYRGCLVAERGQWLTEVGERAS
jgi:hypothetical protein